MPPDYVGMGGCGLSNRLPLNFTPLRTVPTRFTTFDRAFRETPWESRFDLVGRCKHPTFTAPCEGTPRRDLSDGMIESLRVRPVQNPYFLPNTQRLKAWNTWKSRDFKHWDPKQLNVRDLVRSFRIPEDITPTRDELGKVHAPALSSRMVADVKRQYLLHGVPWLFEESLLEHRPHPRDKEPSGQKSWFRRELKAHKVNEALRNMPQMVDDYRRERRAASSNSWFEKMVGELTGDQMVSQFIRKPKFQKL